MVTLQSQEQRVVVPARWQTYERLLAERGDNRAPRYTYSLGWIEIVSPLTPEHEESSDSLKFMVRLAAEKLGIAMRSFGSMTLKREDIQGGTEPDGCFYLGSASRIGGKRRVDLAVDPPPDLIIEIDVANPSLPKLPVHARLGVSEVWRYDGVRLDIQVLDEGEYSQSERSRVLPGVTADKLRELLSTSHELDSIAWQAEVREWVAQL